jgi:hypothetical protein
MMDYHERLLVDCIRKRVAKEEALTPTKLSRVCKMDYRTAQNHFSNIVRKDLGDGTKILTREKCYTEYYRDPPEEQDQTLPVVGLVLMMSIVLSVAVILIPRNAGSHSQVRPWVPLLSPSAFVPLLSGCTYSSTV